MVLALLALNNTLVLIAFGGITAVLAFAIGAAASPYASVHGLLWGTAGSIALGVLGGLLLHAWAARIESQSETMTLAIGTVLLTVGASRALGLSPLVSTLAVGATIANTGGRIEPLVDELRRADPPLYAVFFVLAGAELPVGLLPEIGVTGLAYAGLRGLGKIGGAWLAVRRSDLPTAVRKNLGLCLLSSSSLAIGLTIQIRQQFPQYADAVTAVVLSAVILFEIAGPILARTALFNAGEATLVVPHGDATLAREPLSRPPFTAVRPD